MAKKKVRKLTVTQEIMQSVFEKLEKYTHDVTRKQYARQIKLYIKFCRESYNVRSFDECKEYIQKYSDYLQEKEYSASTIHTYLAAVCAVFEVDLGTITKPIRHVAEYSKGRNKEYIDSNNDIDNPKWAYIVDFQRKVGIRRDELRKLKGKDFVIDESGNPCVIVKKGKGGKTQFQRILDKDVEFVKSYFDAVSADDYLFDKKYFKNDLNFHHMRAECAKEYYFELLKEINSDPNFAIKLEQEIKARWIEMNKTKAGKVKKFLDTELQGIYTLRGKNRELAVAKGLRLHYDKRALLATSIFKLSHWRNDVTIASYLLA